jgi:hypothetical protein
VGFSSWDQGLRHVPLPGPAGFASRADVGGGLSQAGFVSGTPASSSTGPRLPVHLAGGLVRRPAALLPRVPFSPGYGVVTRPDPRKSAASVGARYSDNQAPVAQCVRVSIEYLLSLVRSTSRSLAPHSASSAKDGRLFHPIHRDGV